MQPHTVLLIQWNKFKVILRQLPNFYPNNGYFFTNTLDIKTESLTLNYINPTNQNRLNVIMKLHNKGWSNKEIVTFLNLNGIQRRNKKDGMDHGMFELITYSEKGLVEIIERGQHNLNKKVGVWTILENGKKTKAIWDNDIRKK